MASPVIQVVAAVIERGGRYLLTQRNPQAVLPLLWEFPGGRVERTESPEEALLREVRGRIGCDVDIREKLGEHEHPYDGYTVHMTLFACAIAEGCAPEPVGVNAIQWVTSAEMSEYEFPPADQSSMDKLLGVKRWPETP